MRCYPCSGFGHKAQECASQRSQPRKSPSYKSVTRTYEPWKANAGRFEEHKTKVYSQGHSQAWRHEADRRCVGSSNISVRCWACNNVGHIATHCHMMKCYSCHGFGHKDQYCRSTQKKPLRIFLYISLKKSSTYERRNS